MAFVGVWIGVRRNANCSRWLVFNDMPIAESTAHILICVGCSAMLNSCDEIYVSSERGLLIPFVLCGFSRLYESPGRKPG